MANILAKDAGGTNVEVAAVGSGSSSDPFITINSLVNISKAPINPSTAEGQAQLLTSSNAVLLGQSTAAKQDSILAALGGTLTVNTIAGYATAAQQTTAQTSLTAIDTKLGGTLAVNTGLSLAGLGTQTTLAAIDTKLAGTLTVNTGLSGIATAANQTTAQASLTTIASAQAGLATQTTLAAVNTKLAGTLTVDTGLTGLATSAKQDLLSTAAGQATAQTKLDAIASALALQAIINLRITATRTPFGGTATTSGDQTTAATGAILAPSAGQRIVMTYIVVQNKTTTSVDVLLKGGTSGAEVLPPVVCGPVVGSGIAQLFTIGEPIRLPEATAFIPNLSTATTVRIGGRYFLEYTATGLPV